MPAEEYETRKSELPAVCFAVKCPVPDLEGKPWPDLSEAEKLLQASGEKHSISCATTGRDIVGVRYYTKYMSSEQDVELSFSEAGVGEDNPHSLCPQVYLRITRPLLEGKDLP